MRFTHDGGTAKTINDQLSFDRLAWKTLSRSVEAGERDAIQVDRERYLRWKHGVETHSNGETLVMAKLGDENARNAVIKTNIRLVAKIAKQHVKPGIEYEDLMQEGSLGMLDALMRFRFELGNMFPTYATYYINGKMFRAVESNSSDLRLPEYLYNKNKIIEKASLQYFHANNRNPSPDELASLLHLSKDYIEEAQKLRYKVVSFDIPIKKNSATTFRDLIVSDSPGPEEEAQANERTAALERVLARLDRRSEAAVRMHFLIPYPKPDSEESTLNAAMQDAARRGREHMALEAIGSHLGILGNRVKRIINTALERMRRDPEFMNLILAPPEV